MKNSSKTNIVSWHICWWIISQIWIDVEKNVTFFLLLLIHVLIFWWIKGKKSKNKVPFLTGNNLHTRIFRIKKCARLGGGYISEGKKVKKKFNKKFNKKFWKQFAPIKSNGGVPLFFGYPPLIFNGGKKGFPH